MKEVLEKSLKLYNDGKFLEAIQLIEKNLANFVSDEDIAEANRIMGWSWYYLGIKGPEEEKIEKLFKSKGAFQTALDQTSNPEKRISIMNGLCLTLWVLGEREEALITNIVALSEFPNKASIWNTSSILIRWAKNPKAAVPVCEKVYQTALEAKDYRTAGHGKHNKADALKELGLIEEARKEYLAAIELYKRFERETGQSAKFHIEGVEKKLAAL